MGTTLLNYRSSSDCGKSDNIANGTKLSVSSKLLSDGSTIESQVRYTCRHGFYLDSTPFASHLDVFCMHDADGTPIWSQKSLPKCLAGKTFTFLYVTCLKSVCLE